MPKPGLRSPTHLSGHIRKFGHVSSYMHDVLHWLSLQQRISYDIITFVCRSLLSIAPDYFWDLFCTTLGVLGHRSLRSTEQGFLIIPFAQITTKQNRFSQCSGTVLVP